MMIFILQVIILVLWYVVPALQFVPWWIAWLPALLSAASWVLAILFVAFVFVTALVCKVKASK